MDTRSLIKIREEIFDKCSEIYASKSKEYAKDEDVLSNFREVSEELGIDAMVPIAIYLRKHFSSIISFCNYYLTYNDFPKLSEPIEMRIVDLINYLIFLLAYKKELEYKKIIEESYRENVNDKQ